MSTVEKVRLTSPDFVKGVAILLMVYGHLDHAGSLMAQQREAVKWIYTFHMPLFLLISGFFFKANRDARVSLRNILSKICRPYLIFAALYLCGLWLASRIGVPTSNSAPESVGDFFNTLLLHPRGGYWFLHSLVIIQISLIIPQFFSSDNKVNPLVYFIVASLIWVICVKYNIVMARTIALFMVGFCLGNIWGMFSGSVLAGLAGAVLTAALAWYDLIDLTIARMTWGVSLLCFLSGLAEIKPSAFAVRFFVWIGRNSLGILVFHAIFVVLFKLVSKPILKVEPTGIMNAALATVVCTGACLLTSLFIDRVKLTALLFGSDNVYFRFQKARELKAA